MNDEFGSFPSMEAYLNQSSSYVVELSSPNSHEEEVEPRIEEVVDRGSSNSDEPDDRQHHDDDDDDDDDDDNGDRQNVDVVPNMSFTLDERDINFLREFLKRGRNVESDDAERDNNFKINDGDYDDDVDDDADHDFKTNDDDVNINDKSVQRATPPLKFFEQDDDNNDDEQSDDDELQMYESLFQRLLDPSQPERQVDQLILTKLLLVISTRDDLELSDIQGQARIYAQLFKRLTNERLPVNSLDRIILSNFISRIRDSDECEEEDDSSSSCSSSGSDDVSSNEEEEEDDVHNIVGGADNDGGHCNDEMKNDSPQESDKSSQSERVISRPTLQRASLRAYDFTSESSSCSSESYNDASNKDDEEEVVKVVASNSAHELVVNSVERVIQLHIDIKKLERVAKAFQDPLYDDQERATVQEQIKKTTEYRQVMIDALCANDTSGKLKTLITMIFEMVLLFEQRNDEMTKLEECGAISSEQRLPEDALHHMYKYLVQKQQQIHQEIERGKSMLIQQLLLNRQS